MDQGSGNENWERDVLEDAENLKLGLARFLGRQQNTDQLAARRIVNDLSLFAKQAIEQAKLDPWLIIASYWLIIKVLIEEFGDVGQDEGQRPSDSDEVDTSELPRCTLGKLLLGIIDDEEEIE